MVYSNLYKSVLEKISLLPEAYLKQVDEFLSRFTLDGGKKRDNKKAIMGLAGSWSDMSDTDFEDYLRHSKETGHQLFSRNQTL